MRKTIHLEMNKYPAVPHSLASSVNPSKNMNPIELEVARLFHHYYLDTRGYAPPSPDLAQFEHLQLLLPSTEFRVQGDGFGIGTAFRKHRSNELGQAFCRWFLYEHVGITYFAHMEDVLGRAANPALGGLVVQRIAAGDAPDYFCSQGPYSVYLAEAKGRVGPVSFGSSDFSSWRKQFDRIVVMDGAGVAQAVKGHIVATRFATESKPRVKSTIFAEDPSSPGDRILSEAPGIGSAVIALHYSDIAAKLQQPLLASSLATGIAVPPEIQFPAAVWRVRAGPLLDKRFVGGYFPGPLGTTPIRFENGRPLFLNSDPLRLDVAPGTFVGIEEQIFKRICEMARRGDELALNLEQMPDVPAFDSALSVLRDGSVIGPIHYFEPVDLLVF